MVPGSGKWGERSRNLTCNIAQRLCGSQELGEGRASGGGGQPGLSRGLGTQPDLGRGKERGHMTQSGELSAEKWRTRKA